MTTIDVFVESPVANAVAPTSPRRLPTWSNGKLGVTQQCSQTARRRDDALDKYSAVSEQAFAASALASAVPPQLPMRLPAACVSTESDDLICMKNLVIDAHTAMTCVRTRQV